ncbi:MAG: O-antigen ligase family protein, partial [Candidatus Omnitrophica bacterium]|nr:O-antigen ligase family protein [Candidatus Omnitrophota bacterium]
MFGYCNTFILPVGLFFIWSVITLTKCINIFAGLHSIILFILFITFYISLEDIVVRDSSVIDIFIKYVVGITFIVSVYGILQVSGIDFLRWEVRNSALSTLGRRNFAAEYLVMVIPYIYYLALREKKWFLYIVCVFSIVHLIFTFTRASYLAFFVSVIIFFILAGVKIPVRSKVVFILIILLFSRIGFSEVKRFERGTITSRILIWKVSLKMIRENPFMGVGSGNFIINYPYYGIGEEALRGVSLVVDRVHNDYLEVAAETGIPGLILFLYLLYCFFQVCFILYKGLDREKRLLVAGIICSVVGICVNALASFPFKNPATLLIFWVNISFAGGLYRKLKGEKPVKVNYSLLKIYLVLFTLVGSIVSIMGIKASRCIFFAKSLKGEKALMFAEKSVVYNPFSSEGIFMAAKLATKQAEYKKAYRYLIMQKKYEPYSDTLYNNFGLIYFYLMYFKEAEESFLYSLKLNPIVPDV